MKRILKGVLTLCAGVLLTFQTCAADKGDATEAVAMVKKAVAHYKGVGRERAFAEFSDPASKVFHEKDLYVMVYDLKGNNLAHGANSKLIGKNLIDLKDNDGKMIIRDMIAVANGKGSGWVDYNWPNPVSKAMEKKSTYLEKVDDVFIGVGIYK